MHPAGTAAGISATDLGWVGRLFAGTRYISPPTPPPHTHATPQTPSAVDEGSSEEEEEVPEGAVRFELGAAEIEDALAEAGLEVEAMADVEVGGVGGLGFLLLSVSVWWVGMWGSRAPDSWPHHPAGSCAAALSAPTAPFCDPPAPPAQRPRTLTYRPRLFCSHLSCAHVWTASLPFP